MKNSKTHISPWAWVPTLYLAEGIPYFLVTSISVTLFAQLGVPNSEMALFTSLIAFPWVIKPLWSPFVDILRTKRWWVLTMQALMAVTVLLLALLAPKGLFTLALILFTITAFCSATHDIAGDGYYMIALSETQQSAYVGLRSTFYRIANIFCQSLLLMLVGWLQRHTDVASSWTYALLLCSGILALIALWHAWAMPKVETNDQRGPDWTIDQIFRQVGIVFADFFRKPEIILALCFMLLYRLPEALLLKLCNPFFLAPQAEGGLGISVGTIGQITGIGVILMLLGGIGGGLWASKTGLKKAILPMALCLTLPCFVYVYFALYQPTSFWILCLCVGIEQLGYGLGYTACMLYMMHLAEGAYRTAHFSICTAFMFLGLMLPGMVAGYIQEAVGYLGFFWIVMITCIPSILITYLIYRKL
ncbi:MAG: MFS transporter [Paludibacteraceae bacterium]|nr:MFS transporter [Paludibacteraceae bacterium]